ncbi:MAG: hypothetical protein KME23_04775 [Goleter apudmare HA4340-LM2]|jgi:hypothetical protein|nr:hypothetical protein [Goleter apudmare HA4340-LM2]
MNNNNSDVETPDSDMLPEYDFTGGVRGKHDQEYQQGHMVTIHQADGTTVFPALTLLIASSNSLILFSQYSI